MIFQIGSGGMRVRCVNYCGVTCVNGSCPNALADEYPEYGYEHCTCDECGYYKGCEDCCFVDKPEYCDKSGGQNGSVDGF